MENFTKKKKKKNGKKSDSFDDHLQVLGAYLAKHSACVHFASQYGLNICFLYISERS